MFLRTGALAVALSLAAATAVMAQPATVSLDTSGRIVRVDAPYNVLVMEDGRMYRITQGSTVFVNGQPVPVSALQPGSLVVIRSGEAVTMRDGQYVVAASPTPVVVAPSAAPRVVAAPPEPTATVPATVVSTAPIVKRTIYGRVTDVDKDGEVTIKTDKGEFDVMLTPDTVRQIRKGDTVMIDTTFSPPGTQLR